MDNIVKIGSQEKIQECIITELSISPSDAKKVFDYLETAYQENTTEFGRIDQKTTSGQGLVFGNEQYYINLPKSVLMVAALILDITLTKGIVSGVCGMLGIQTQTFYRINQHKGEVCLLRELLRNRNAVNSDKYNYLMENECINNDLKCQFRSEDGQCRIQKTDIDKALSRFKEAQIINNC